VATLHAPTRGHLRCASIVPCRRASQLSRETSLSLCPCLAGTLGGTATLNSARLGKSLERPPCNPDISTSEEYSTFLLWVDMHGESLEETDDPTDVISARVGPGQ
jgi:hypothetical protein